MTFTTKLFIFLAILCGILTAGFIVYKQIEISNKQASLESNITQQKELADKILRSMSQYASKEDIENLAKTQNLNIDAVKKDLASLNATIKSINTVGVVTPGYNGSSLPSTSTTPSANPSTSDTNGYLANVNHLTLNEPFSDGAVPFGSVAFDGSHPKPWDLSIYPRAYSVTTVYGEDENEKQYAYSKFNISVQGKDYSVKLDKASLVQEFPAAKFRWWAPQLFLGPDLGATLISSALAPNAHAGATLSFGAMSYGMLKNSPDISVLQVGLGYEAVQGKPKVVITPIAVKAPIPLTNNTYIGPSLSLGFDGAVGVTGSLRIGL